MVTKKFPGKFTSLADISGFVKEHAKAAGLNDKDVYAVQLAVDEACSNIIEHAYGGEGKGVIECACNAIEDGLQVIIRDKGMPFDPQQVQELNVGAPLEALGNRGAGVFLINKLMDEVQYQYTKSGGTTLTMSKKK